MVRTLYYPIPQFNCEETLLENDEEEEDERNSAAHSSPSCINMWSSYSIHYTSSLLRNAPRTLRQLLLFSLWKHQVKRPGLLLSRVLYTGRSTHKHTHTHTHLYKIYTLWPSSPKEQQQSYWINIVKYLCFYFFFSFVSMWVLVTICGSLQKTAND